MDGDLVFCREWRPDTCGTLTSVLAVRLIAEHPPPAILDRLVHEYGLKDELDRAWAVRPLEIVREIGRPMLVLEDPGGEPLHHLLGEPTEMGTFLRLAVPMTAALGKVHQRGLVHKDIKPHNVLVSRETGEIKLTGFGIASRLMRERQAPEPPERIAGTLAYMAPEQTGRMNRSIDSRRPIRPWRHLLPDAYRISAVCRVRSDGVGALSHCKAADRARRSPSGSEPHLVHDQRRRSDLALSAGRYDFFFCGSLAPRAALIASQMRFGVAGMST